MGRPPVEIDAKIFENLCSIFCTLDEIAGVFGCSADTIERWCKREYKITFAEAYKKASGKGRMSLRRMQFKLAEKNAAMAIFLGKNYLGQSDVMRVESRADGSLADLIDGLKEPVDYDLHAETASVDGAVADEQAETD